MRFGAWAGMLWMIVMTPIGFGQPTPPVSGVTTNPPGTNLSFAVHGTVRKVRAAEHALVVAHDAIPGYMPAMTMSFRVRQTNELAGLRTGDAIRFRLIATAEESWIEQIRSMEGPIIPTNRVEQTATNLASIAPAHQPLLDYFFTNELGAPVSLSQFKGQALAITFFFTRCPIPEYCPRLSKNFQESSRKLRALPHAPTNWHFLSVTFDPAFDTPDVLRAYARSYDYDPRDWSFLTGAPDKIAELARASDVTATPEGGLFNHNFRTLIINARGELQMNFPVSGNLSEAIVTEMLKAVAATNRPH